MTDLPILPDWVLIEAAKRSGWSDLYTLDTLQRFYANDLPYRALCDMIAKHEQPPADRKLLCAREASDAYNWNPEIQQACVRAIELWEEGFGK